MLFLILVFLIHTAFSTPLVANKLDRYIIACHTTDFECFKRQYLALRDHVLFGNKFLGIPPNKPFAFKYGLTQTCVQLTGLELSQLMGISFDNSNKEYSMVIQMPMKISQVKGHAMTCLPPDKAFKNPIPVHVKGPMMRFTGNATIQVSYPFKLRKKNGEVHLELDEEDVDLVLDVPDLSHFDTTSEVESRLYMWSEWAYEAVQHVDAAQRFAIPYTAVMRRLMDKVPLKHFILLYPEENYSDLSFIYTSGLQS